MGVLGLCGRLPPRAIPALLLQQDWALGLIGLKFAHHLVAGMPDGRPHLFGRPFRETFLHLLWAPLQVCLPLSLQLIKVGIHADELSEFEGVRIQHWAWCMS